jgi:hypothetical protein
MHDSEDDGDAVDLIMKIQYPGAPISPLPPPLAQSYTSMPPSTPLLHTASLAHRPLSCTSPLLHTASHTLAHHLSCAPTPRREGIDPLRPTIPGDASPRVCGHPQGSLPAEHYTGGQGGALARVRLRA